MFTKEFIKKRDKLLSKYFPEVMTVKTSENTKNSLYEGLIVGYYSGLKKEDKLFNDCYSIYDDRNYEIEEINKQTIVLTEKEINSIYRKCLKTLKEKS